jgi:hypothetical protein
MCAGFLAGCTGRETEMTTLSNMQQAMIAILEDGIDPDFRIDGLIEHHACLFSVSENDLRHEVSLYAIPSMIKDVQDGYCTLIEATEKLEDDFASEAE